MARRAIAIILTLLFSAWNATVHAQLFHERDYDADEPASVTTNLDTPVSEVETNTFPANQTLSPDPKVNDLLQYAFRFIGSRYRGGATGPKAFDCSGYTLFVFSHVDYSLPHSSSAQAAHGSLVKKGDWQPGDLVFFNGQRAGGSRIGHVGIVTQNNRNGSFRFIHASTSQGVREDQSDDRYYSRRYVTARRIFGKAPIYADDQENTSDITSSKSNSITTKTETVETETTYEVRKGDNLFSIARRHGCSVKELKEWNNLRGIHLSIGQQLIIKKEETRIVTVTDTATTQPKQPVQKTSDTQDDNETPRFHIVEKGETLYSISVHYEVPVKEIRRLNNLEDNTIRIGQELRLR